MLEELNKLIDNINQEYKKDEYFSKGFVLEVQLDNNDGFDWYENIKNTKDQNLVWEDGFIYLRLRALSKELRSCNNFSIADIFRINHQIEELCKHNTNYFYKFNKNDDSSVYSDGRICFALKIKK